MDATNHNTALATAFAEELSRRGVGRAVICPGSRSTPLALALDRHPGIEATVVLDERSAGFLALGMAAASGDPVALVTTSGTAAANLHPAICEADLSHLPLIALTCDRPAELRGIGAGQTIDQIKLFGDGVRWFCEVGTHEADDQGLLHYRSIASRAVAHACDGWKPGPVHLNFAWREPLAPLPDADSVSAELGLARDGRSAGRPHTAVTPRPPQPDSDTTHAAGELIGSTGKGVILAGRQRDPALARRLALLSLRTGYPVLAEPTSQARLTSAGDAVIWSYDWIARYGPSALRPELVLRFGEFPTSKALRAWLAREAVEQLAVLEAGWSDPTLLTSVLIRGRPAETAKALADELGPGAQPADAGWRRLWLEAQDAVSGATDAAVTGSLTEPALHRALGGRYSDGDLVYTASSMPIRDQEFFLPVLEAAPLFLANRGANGIDGLVSSAIGAAIASHRPTWVITGDLGFVHDSNALISLREAQVPVRVLVINNNGGGIFEHLPQAEALERREFERLFLTPSGVDVVALCAAHGIDYVQLDSPAQLADLPAASCVIEARTDSRADTELRREIAARTRDALVEALSIT